MRQPSTNVSGELGIELGAGAALELGQSSLDRERRPVRPVRGHRVERVRDAEQAGLDRDLLAAEAVRVARPVPALVVVEHVRQGGAEVRDSLDQRVRPRPDAS